jgi:tetratricopeptide (TPR) repeat protein
MAQPAVPTASPAVPQAPPPPTNESIAAKPTAALALSYRGRHGESLPMLEELAKNLPSDSLIWERYALALYSMSATLTDVPAAQQMRLQAKAAFARTRELGNTSALAALGNAIPSDGSVPPLSRNPEAQAAMAAGEAAFARGDFTEAIPHYQKALSIDPTNYLATLFVGDCYYRLKNVEDAADWFARAVALNPDAETAYRYWGDLLMRAGRGDEARSKFIDAFIAEPYSQAARTGLAQWAKTTGGRLGRPAITPFSGLPRTADGRVTIDLKTPPDDPMAAAWVVYATAKAQWSKEEFLKRFPNESTYRVSLAEEIDAFGRLLAYADEQQAKGQPITDPQIATIRALRNRGMLEAYVLLHAPSAGVARDYPAYRAAHRDRLQAYMEAMTVMPSR